jgi:D-alanyl-D-alanine carboxypeptidase
MTRTHHKRIRAGGRLLAFALILMLLTGCAVPASSPAATSAVSAAAAPAATPSPVPVLTPEPIATTMPDGFSPAPATASAAVSSSAAPSPSPSPSPTPRPSSPSAVIGQLVCIAGDSANIRSTAGQPDIDVPSGDWASILVNQSSLLPDGFSVEVADFSGGQVDKRILSVCKAMFADAKKDGVTLKLVDAYRSHDLQKRLFEDKVSSYLAKGYSQEDAEAEAATITARPGTSEHQTGLALDIVTPSYTKRDKGFANTDAFQWLNANAQDYGFTLRYKKGKQDLTGVIYESWHWRFVGVNAARAMKQSGEVLEEYWG